MFFALFRITGWVIGAYSLASLIALTGNVSFSSEAQLWMARLAGILDLGFLLKPLEWAIILPALELLRSFGFHVSTLQAHWQPLFVLMWLQSLAFQRGASSNISNAGEVFFEAAWFNLLFCVAAGTMPIDSRAFVILPLLGFLVFLVLRATAQTTWHGSVVGMMSIIYAHVAYQSLRPHNTFWSRDFDGAVVILIWLCGFLGAGSILAGLFGGDGKISKRLRHASLSAGTDVFVVIMGAYGLVMLFAEQSVF
jgi:hypothetical protein